MTIFDEADDVDQLALALSCKHLLQASTLVSLKTSVCAGYWVNPYRLRALLAQLLSPTTNAWKICTICTRYRPTRKRYWKAKADLQKWNIVKAKEPELITTIINDWKHAKKTTFCPECMWERVDNNLYNDEESN